MPQQLASLRIAIETGDLKKASDELKKLEKAGRKSEKATDKLANSTKKLNSSLFSMKNAVIAVVGSMAVRKVIKYADAMTLVDSKLKLVTDSTSELIDTQNKLFDIAQNTRSEFTSTVDLYSRIARSTKDYNVEQKELLALTDSINKAMIISGGTAESMNAAVIQLGQAFSADFQSVGQELASIREQTPRLYEAMLKGTNLSTKAFKKQAEEGKLSSKIIIDALRSQGMAVAEEFGQINMTVDQSMTVFSNSLMKAIGNLDDATEASSTLASGISDLAKLFDDNEKEISEFGEFTFATIGKMVDGFELLHATASLGVTTLMSVPEFAINQFMVTIAKASLEIKELANEASQALGLGDKFGDAAINRAYREVDLAIDKQSQSVKKLKGETKEVAEALKAWNVSIEDRIKLNKKEETATRKKPKIITKKDIKEAEKATEKMWKNIGDIAQSNITSALQAGLDGDLDPTAFTSQLTKAIGQAMLFSGGIAGFAGGLGLMGLGSLLGGGRDEQKARKTAEEKAEESLNKFLDGLDTASKALEQFGNIGSAIGGRIISLQRATSREGIMATGLKSEVKRNEAIVSDIEAQILKLKAARGDRQEDIEWQERLLSEARANLTAAQKTHNASLSLMNSYTSEISKVVKSSLADTLDISKLSTEQLEEVTAGIDVDAMKAYDTELNNIALSMKLGTNTAEDIARATEILSDAEFAKFQDFSEAFDLLGDSISNTTSKVNEAMLGSLSYLTEVEKLNYANNIYQSAISQEDRISSSRTIAELSRGQTRTKEDFVPAFTQYLNELKKQGEEATLTDVVDELQLVNANIISSTESATQDATYA